MPPVLSRSAEELKAEGNALFKREKYGAAIEKYTEAITLCPDVPVLYINRALCHKKRQEWKPVLRDCRTALGLSKDLLKAHYLLGVALREEHQLAEAISHLNKALEAAREQGDSIKDEIWRELAKAKYGEWKYMAELRRQQQVELKRKLEGYLQRELESDCKTMSRESAQSKHDAEKSQWYQLFEMAEERDKPQEMPNAVTCRLTMEVFREPAITPGGQSYERASLLEHIKKVGKFDPITREPLTESDLVLNLGLRAATQHYLDEHPWAWADCI